jgi:hypothetical protein
MTDAKQKDDKEEQPASKGKPKEKDNAGKDTPTNPAVNAIQAILESGTTAAQANLLLELTEHLAEGKAVSSVVSDVCRVRMRPKTSHKQSCLACADFH